MLPVLQGPKVATKAKVLDLREDLVRAKINTATSNNKAIVEEGTLAEVVGVGEGGETVRSRQNSPAFGLADERSSGVWASTTYRKVSNLLPSSACIVILPCLPQ